MTKQLGKSLFAIGKNPPSLDPCQHEPFPPCWFCYAKIACRPLEILNQQCTAAAGIDRFRFVYIRSSNI